MCATGSLLLPALMAGHWLSLPGVAVDQPCSRSVSSQDPGCAQACCSPRAVRASLTEMRPSTYLTFCPALALVTGPRPVLHFSTWVLPSHLTGCLLGTTHTSTSASQTGLLAMWQCTRTAPADVVTTVLGTMRFSPWHGSCSPGAAAPRLGGCEAEPLPMQYLSRRVWLNQSVRGPSSSKELRLRPCSDRPLSGVPGHAGWLCSAESGPGAGIGSGRWLLAAEAGFLMPHEKGVRRGALGGHGFPTLELLLPCPWRPGLLADGALPGRSSSPGGLWHRAEGNKGSIISSSKSSEGWLAKLGRSYGSGWWVPPVV